MSAADILKGLSEAAPMLLSLIPGGALVAPWVSAGLGLASRAARAGLSPEHITRIDLAALGSRRAEADARLDALVPRPGPGVRGFPHDGGGVRAAHPVGVARDVPSTDPEVQTVDAGFYPDDLPPGEQGPGTVLP